MKFRKNQADGTMGILSVAVIRTYERGTNPLFREALVLFRVAIGIAVNFRIPVFIRCNMLACLFQHSDPAAGAFVRKFLQFAVFLNRQAAVPIFGQLLLPIISSFASHAVLPLLRFVEEHTTLSDSNPDGAGWALTCQTAHYRWSFEFNFSQSAEEAEFLDIENHSGSHSTFSSVFSEFPSLQNSGHGRSDRRQGRHRQRSHSEYVSPFSMKQLKQVPP